MYPPILRVHLKHDQQRTDHIMLIRCFCPCYSDFLYKNIRGGYSFELHRQVDAIQMGTDNICHYKELDKKKYTGCNLKIMDLLDCAFIGICTVIRSNMVTVLARILFI